MMVQMDPSILKGKSCLTPEYISWKLIEYVTLINMMEITTCSLIQNIKAEQEKLSKNHHAHNRRKEAY